MNLRRILLHLYEKYPKNIAGTGYTFWDVLFSRYPAIKDSSRRNGAWLDYNEIGQYITSSSDKKRVANALRDWQPQDFVCANPIDAANDLVSTLEKAVGKSL